MAIKFQYNKTSLGELGKQLKMRQKALPTIKSKESALRSEVKKAKDTAQDFQRQLDALTAQGRVRTRVLQTNERWFGLTYQDDKPGVVAALRALHADGTYPPALWK